MDSTTELEAPSIKLAWRIARAKGDAAVDGYGHDVVEIVEWDK